MPPTECEAPEELLSAMGGIPAPRWNTTAQSWQKRPVRLLLLRPLVRKDNAVRGKSADEGCHKGSRLPRVAGSGEYLRCGFHRVDSCPSFKAFRASCWPSAEFPNSASVTAAIAMMRAGSSVKWDMSGLSVIRELSVSLPAALDK